MTVLCVTVLVLVSDLGEFIRIIGAMIV